MKNVGKSKLEIANVKENAIAAIHQCANTHKDELKSLINSAENAISKLDEVKSSHIATQNEIKNLLTMLHKKIEEQHDQMCW